MMVNRLREFIKREWFLSSLFVLYIALLLRDGSLLERTPDLIDWGGLALITSLILVSKGLELSGAFAELSILVINLSRGSEKRLALILLPTIALSSAIIMNDTAMLIFIPFIVALSRLIERDTAALVIFSAIAANVGSSLTPIGNPQNIIIWRRYGVPFQDFIAYMLPFVLLWLILLLLFAFVTFRGSLPERKLQAVKVRESLLWSSLFLLIINIVLAREERALWTLPLTVVILSLVGKDVLLSFDWALVLTFAFIFVDFGELSGIMASLGLHPPSSEIGLFLFSALLSQVVSNVPATVLLFSAENWGPLAVGVNAGGTGFMVGSLANLIAIRIARVSIGKFHRYSVPYFLLILLLSALLLGILP
ncbi:SLC13 family permease [Thermococcus waiotapuensis]|uniref:Sodium:proton antiporter n=1 Tax=Thermococcus waiotapuensis TaxID=90909 RepID=A0AAE4NVC8_9EURY|nr:SLC13 family permease [Thermococcus waiotapuensis]MDV3104579.1 sodium:proton antiporter [Thermococcus waiotapuensis]